MKRPLRIASAVGMTIVIAISGRAPADTLPMSSAAVLQIPDLSGWQATLVARSRHSGADPHEWFSLGLHRFVVDESGTSAFSDSISEWKLQRLAGRSVPWYWFDPTTFAAHLRTRITGTVFHTTYRRANVYEAWQHQRTETIMISIRFDVRWLGVTEGPVIPPPWWAIGTRPYVGVPIWAAYTFPPMAGIDLRSGAYAGVLKPTAIAGSITLDVFGRLAMPGPSSVQAWSGGGPDTGPVYLPAPLKAG